MFTLLAGEGKEKYQNAYRTCRIIALQIKVKLLSGDILVTLPLKCNNSLKLFFISFIIVVVASETPTAAKSKGSPAAIAALVVVVLVLVIVVFVAGVIFWRRYGCPWDYWSVLMCFLVQENLTLLTVTCTDKTTQLCLLVWVWA